MNFFNCMQAVSFYTILPILAQWCFNNNHIALGWVAVIVTIIGLCLLAVCVHEFKK